MNEYYKANFEKYLAWKINLDGYEKDIKEKYQDIYLSGYSLENTIYKLDDADLKYLESLFYSNEMDTEKIFSFIERTFSKVLRYKLADNIKIYYDGATEGVDNFVNDGTLVWKIKYREKLNVDITEQLKMISNLELLIKKYDEKMRNILNVDVKTYLVPFVLVE